MTTPEHSIELFVESHVREGGQEFAERVKYAVGKFGRVRLKGNGRASTRRSTVEHDSNIYQALGFRIPLMDDRLFDSDVFSV